MLRLVAMHLSGDVGDGGCLDPVGNQQELQLVIGHRDAFRLAPEAEVYRGAAVGKLLPVDVSWHGVNGSPG